MTWRNTRHSSRAEECSVSLLKVFYKAIAIVFFLFLWFQETASGWVFIKQG